MAKKIKALNVRLQQQMNNLKRDFQYVLINLQLAKVYVFVNGSFINNKNLSSQIEFVLVISIKSKGIAEFILIKNIIYISLTKCKRVICIILALKLYAIAIRVDILIALLSIINMIIDKFKIKQLLIIIYINSLSLYKCIVKLGTTKKTFDN